jgi:hexosaminidase
MIPPTAAACSTSEGPAVIPRPVELTRAAGWCTPHTVVYADEPETQAVAAYLADILSQAGGRPVAMRQAETLAPAQDDGVVMLLLRPGGSLGAEGYELHVTPHGVTLAASTRAGLGWGVQTMRQLLSHGTAGCRLPAVTVHDWPRFRHRGLMLDCCRHFHDAATVQRYIDLVAYHKLNVLHWHLTEDQGWRLEIRKHPRLTEVGAWREVTRPSEQQRDARGRYGGFFTQDEVRALVAYADVRGVTIIPEIELPGHCRAALASYPELSCRGEALGPCTQWGIMEDVFCAGNEAVFAFLEDVLDEVVALFPSPYIHIGGDECPKARWRVCPKCQARMRSEGLKNEEELQSYFVRRVERMVTSRGRRVIGWDEILEGGLAPGATVQSWRSLMGAVAAARAGHDAISSPHTHCYLNYPPQPDPQMPSWMEVSPLEKMYGFEPVPAELTPKQAGHIVGMEAAIWTELCPPPQLDAQVFPRLCALAEVAWSPQALRDFGDFTGRLAPHLGRLAALGVQYYRPTA